MAKNQFYVVWQGKTPGIYSSWDDAKKQIEGFPDAKYKGFPDKKSAETAFEKGFKEFISFRKKEDNQKIAARPSNSVSLSVDAACSGNPGVMEYRGVDTQTGVEIFRKGPFPEGTNNIGEFLAIVHALALLKKKDSKMPIYSDSEIAIGWIKQKKCKSKLTPSPKNKELFELINRAEKWLATNAFPNKIYKWETKQWGENPADFGRK